LFSRKEEIDNIQTFSLLSIIKAILLTRTDYEIRQIRQQLDPHWSDGYLPSLDQYFEKDKCKLCQKEIQVRKKHFHEECLVVKRVRRKSNSIEQFEGEIWNLS